jgi:hypothetical protein
MRYGILRWSAVFACGFAAFSTARATSVARLSFEELTDQSEIVVSGQINRSWAEWDAEHKYIWTRYELGVSGTLKGSVGSTVTLSEPGGIVGDKGMNIAGAVGYQLGERVVVFLQRMPNGYLRTAGWSQGKFRVDQDGKLHGDASAMGAELVVGANARAATPLRSIEGLSVAQLRGLVSARAGRKP